MNTQTSPDNAAGPRPDPHAAAKQPILKPNAEFDATGHLSLSLKKTVAAHLNDPTHRLNSAGRLPGFPTCRDLWRRVAAHAGPRVRLTRNVPALIWS